MRASDMRSYLLDPHTCSASCVRCAAALPPVACGASAAMACARLPAWSAVSSCLRPSVATEYRILPA